MIIDTLENLGKYVVLNPLFAEVVEFLKSHDLLTMEQGSYPIKDKDVTLKLSLTKQRTKESAFLETHIEMIDIQVPITCAETFGYTPLCDLPAFEYDAENDIQHNEQYPDVNFLDGRCFIHASEESSDILLPSFKMGQGD